MGNLYRDIKELLITSDMEPGEARAISLLLLERVCGLTPAQVLSGMGDDSAATAQEAKARLLRMATRVAEGEPVQYVLGEAEFCGLRLHVEPGVLIPRPETEELVAWAMEEVRQVPSPEGASLPDSITPKNHPLRILDIGTGSGCIAIAIAQQLKASGRSVRVEAWDVSPDALRVAHENARLQGVQVEFRQVDVLALPPISPFSMQQPHTSMQQLHYGTTDWEENDSASKFDLIISNPPYICEEERAEMEKNVLEHEPEMALFVPDDDPLRFYRKIAQLGQVLLKQDGTLLFEINRRFGTELITLLESMGYGEVELRQDQHGNDRMVKTIKPARLSFLKI